MISNFASMLGYQTHSLLHRLQGGPYFIGRGANGVRREGLSHVDLIIQERATIVFASGDAWPKR